ncbi:hypothetical protein [Pseudomonas chlororaphis]|uniref:Uncharacterized protein n=1 Tax=Pseudomonas chlororaphis TaxID=587753 RepID=A0A1Q8EMF3_9PSED|nr:hypothetical protein [Pseudomonas chlororaphis]OLF52947.1 hypothetical protein BTN82_19440 [Pseudomonas chlororaphis]
MLLKKLTTVSVGVLLFFKAMANDKESYSCDLACIKSDPDQPSSEDPGYKILTGYRADDYFVFDAAAIGPASQNSAIFGAHLEPGKLQSLLDPLLNDSYVFSAALERLPASLASVSEKNT